MNSFRRVMSGTAITFCLFMGVQVLSAQTQQPDGVTRGPVTTEKPGPLQRPLTDKEKIAQQKAVKKELKGEYAKWVNEDVRWIIKQVLESGAMGIIVAQVENREQALKVIESMRYPQLKTSKYQDPPGRRGCGCSGGNGWGLQNPADYVRLADVWPLNPEGELLALPMIENPEGVRNINAILDVPGVGGVLVDLLAPKRDHA